MARKLIVFGVLGVLLLVGISLVVIDARDQGQFCTMEGILDDNAPPGWELNKDHYNDCQWTLVNGRGDRAPAELYDSVPVDPPSPPPINRSTIGYTLIVIALGGTIGAVLLGRRVIGDPESSRSGDPI
ncbi:MAG: hypothetical protein ACR2NG_00230 [Acidimicrobiia bacterium]